MKIKKIYYSSRFLKALKQLSVQKKKLIVKREKIFRIDCFDSRLKTHKLKGKWQDYWAFSITYSERILFRFLKKGEVVFINVGTHEIYRYPRA